MSYNFPYYPPEPLVKRAPRLDQDGLDLVERFLLYQAKKRISAREAMRHPYFGPSLGPAATENLLDGKFTTKYWQYLGVGVGVKTAAFTVSLKYHLHLFLFSVQSIFTIPGVHLSKDPGYRSSAFSHASSGKSRRQSMLL